MTGVERQGYLRTIDLIDDLAKVDHPAPRMNSGWHILDTDRQTSTHDLPGERLKTSGQCLTTLLSIFGLGESPWMHDQAGSTNFVEPIQAPSQIIDALGPDPGIGTSEINSLGLDGLPSPTSVRAMDGQTEIVDQTSEGQGIRVGSPVGKDLKNLGAELLGDGQIPLNGHLGKSVDDHGT